MKHHIAIKFIAIFLATLTLLAAIGSAAGIIGLSSMDLYEKTYSEIYEESMAGIRRTFAVNLAHRYASLHLGGLPEQYLNEYHGNYWLYSTFEYDKFCYAILNENGEVVESTLFDDLTGAASYKIVVTDISYRHVVTDTGDLPQDGPDASAEASSTEPTFAPEETTSPALDATAPEAETSVTEGPEGPTDEWASGQGLPDTADSYSVSRASESSGTVPLYQDGYWDHETESYVEFTFYYDTLPAYAVELYLFPGALPEDALWSLLHTVYGYRTELFYILGVSLFLFAVALVYLCCAAGRRPGSQEVRPGGLNRLPLDLYLFAGGGAILLLIALFVNLGYEVARYMPHLLAPGLLLGGYAASLIFVGLLYACITQFKAPGGFWWRHSFIGFLLLKFWHLLKRLGRFCRRIGGSIQAMTAMMPLIWQWLLTAALMVVVPLLLLFFVLLFRYADILEFFFILLFISSIAADIAIICYGAYCFGTLMKGARQMAQGDLDRKVPTKYLFGCFKDFALQLNALADAAQVAAARQMRSERMKTELITNVSHDIKTPLTSIINYVDLMQKPHTEEEGTMYLEVLSRQSLRLKKLIDDLMDMSKASTGNMSVEVTRMDAAEAVNQALGEFADKLTLAQLIPVFRPPEKPVYMLADGRLVWRVMSNLLSNAVKYALPGTRLYIDLMELEGKTVISMKNISREELNVSADELLERFVRGDASRNTEGSGLGLNIAQSLMELQHGQLQLLVDGDLFKVTLVFPSAD